MDPHIKKPNSQLRYQREKRGWSQRRVAEQLDVAEDKISRWERGERVPGPFYREKLVALFGLDAEELGFIDHAQTINTSAPVISSSSNKTIVTEIKQQSKAQASETTSSTSSELQHATYQGALLTAQMLENQGLDMDKVRRSLLLAFGITASSSLITAPQALLRQTSINDDYLTFFESELKARWDLYHLGGAARAHKGLDLWIQQAANLVESAYNSPHHKRSLTLLSMSYQLQGCVLRDRMEYDQAHNVNQKAYRIAIEAGDSELSVAALTREGISYVQQEKPLEAIAYLEGALSGVKHLNLPNLSGYTLQALSEAYAKAKLSQESLRSIGLAEEASGQLKNRQERDQRNQGRLTTSSVIAQRAVNASLLHEYGQAVKLIDQSLTKYDPTLIRGRARLIAQKAEAYYGLGEVEACTTYAQEALELAQSVGSSKTITRISELYVTLMHSSLRKENGVARLGAMLSDER